MRTFLNLKACVKTEFTNNFNPLLRTTAMEIVVKFPGYHCHIQSGDNDNDNNKDFNFLWTKNM